MTWQPKTERKIYRLGDPIPFPTTLDEYREQLLWALDELHVAWHMKLDPKHKPLAEETLGEAVADQCRMAVALRDERFRCEDAWHDKYQPDSGPCPTCRQSWICMARS